METPFIGKKSDVLNKKGTIALFKGQEEDAIRLWTEATLLNDRHFDSKCNVCLHRWRTGRINDAQLMSELRQFVFNVADKGECMEVFLHLASGERNTGREMLEQFIQKTRQKVADEPMVSNKTKQILESAVAVEASLQKEPHLFFQNQEF